jgi:hypothetical protein
MRDYDAIGDPKVSAATPKAVILRTSCGNSTARRRGGNRWMTATKSELHRLAGRITRLRIWRVVGDAIEIRVRVRLESNHADCKNKKTDNVITFIKIK